MNDATPMSHDPASCYRALECRDARFDGRFFTAVVTTGIFCRPLCPAPTPKRANCRFYGSAAAAMAAGFRPCLRCRPEAAPRSPAWNGVSTTVARALRLIDEGALDEDGVEALAARLGVGGRHLRRLFADHLGTGPKAVAQARRLLFAKRLVTETDQPLTRIAHAAGFASLRRFNDAFLALYGRPPRALRRDEPPARAHGEGPLTLLLSFRPPYDWPRVMDFLATRAVPGLEMADRDGYRRAIRLDGIAGMLTVRPALERHRLAVTVDLPHIGPLRQVIERCRRLFDLDADCTAIAADLGSDPLLAALVAKRPGLRVPGAWDLFELAVRAVLGQQVSVAAARTFTARLMARLGDPLDGGDGRGISHLFPTPERLAEADLAAIGLTRRRAATVRSLAAVFASGAIDLDAAVGLDDAVARLCALPGIGPWTAHYIAMRGLAHPDAFPSGDLGLMRAVAARERTVDAAGLDARAAAWRPWRAYAAMHLWTSQGTGEQE